MAYAKTKARSVADLDVLLVTDDASLLETNSPARARIMAQATQVKKFHVLLRSPKRVKESVQHWGQNVWVYIVSSPIDLLVRFQIMNTLRKQIYFKGQLQVGIILADNPYWPGTIAVQVAKLFKKHLHINVDQDFLDPYFVKSIRGAHRKRAQAKRNVWAADAVAVSTYKVMQSLLAWEPRLESRLTVVEPYINMQMGILDQNTQTLAQKYPQYTFVMLMMTRLTPEKNIPMALRVLRRIVDAYPRTGMVIVGEGKSRGKLRRLVRKLKLGNHVIFEPVTPDRYAYYLSANMMLITSNYEDHNIELLEALSASCPVITTRTGLAERTLADTRFAKFICNVGNEQCIYENTRSLITSLRLRDEFRINAKFTVEHHLGYSQTDYLRALSVSLLKVFQ